MPELQVVPARHGVATFVPAGQSIKIVNTSGSQVVDTWAFALPTKPDAAAGGEEQKQKQDDEQQQQQQQKDAPKKNEQPQQQQQQQKEEENPAARPTPKKSRKSGVDLPTQEEAEKATREGIEKGDGQQGQQQTQQKNTWSSYMPSIGWSGKNGTQQQGEQSQQSQQKGETEKQKNSRTWASYMPSGKAYSSYIPKGASDTVASFASTHARDPNKSYVQQLKDFSQTPVGAAGIKGIAAFSGSGYSGSLYAGYQAWNAMNAPDAAGMEFLSMQHTRSSTLHLIPKVDDVLVSNLREPMLTLVEDTSSGGCHDTLMAACDPPRYKQLGVEHWEEHGSCAENLVLALKELNERAGLKGANAVGAEVTINNVPAPLNLFMNVPWQESGDIDFKSPRTKAGDYVRLRADRDVVVVMSSCPQDVTDINGGKITDAHFLVEGGEGDDNSAEEKRKPIPRRRPAPRKINSSKTVATGEMGDDDKSQVGSTPVKKKPLARKTPVKKTAQSQAGGATPADAARKPAGASNSTAQTATKKKTVPKPAGTPARAGEGQGNAAQNGTSTPSDGKPVEKKKPRKLVRSTPAPAQNGGGE